MKEFCRRYYCGGGIVNVIVYTACHFPDCEKPVELFIRLIEYCQRESVVHFSIQIYIVGTLKRKRTSQNPVEFCADDRILYRSIDELRNLSKEKIESRLCFRHTLNRHSFKRLQLWLDLLLLFLRHNR